MLDNKWAPNMHVCLWGISEGIVKSEAPEEEKRKGIAGAKGIYPLLVI